MFMRIEGIGDGPSQGVGAVYTRILELMKTVYTIVSLPPELTLLSAPLQVPGRFA